MSETWGPVFGTRHARKNIQRASTLPMTRTRPCTLFSLASATILVSALLLSAGMPAGTAVAQERSSSGNFLDNLFNRGDSSGQQRQAPQQAQGGRGTQDDPGDLSVRLDRMENALRQLTGKIENLQYRNKQLEMQLRTEVCRVTNTDC